ncbi:MAG: DUF3025 domain-containing protein, partial [Nitrospirota bacterium]
MSQQVDWAAPWLAPFCEAGHVLEQRILTGASVCLALNGAGASGVTFVPQRDLPNGMAYEPFIFDTGQVPTRENLHDFFNGLVWLHLPQAKRRMNQLQAQAIAA